MAYFIKKEHRSHHAENRFPENKKRSTKQNVEVWNFDDAEFIYQTLANTLPGAVATVEGIQKELQWVGGFTGLSTRLFFC